MGKTTTAINLSASLACPGTRVLLVDADPQGNATVGSGIALREPRLGVYEVLLGDGRIDEAIISTASGYDILPSHPDLSGAQVEMSALENRDFRLSRALQTVRHRYDFILIDCPPALNVLTVNALTASSEALIPVQCEYYALEGLTSLIETVSLVQQGLNPGLGVLGLVRTMYDGRNSLSNEVSEQLLAHFGDSLFRTIIPRNVRLAEAPSYGQPVLEYDRQCAGSRAYLALACEVLRRQSRQGFGLSSDPAP